MSLDCRLKQARISGTNVTEDMQRDQVALARFDERLDDRPTRVCHAVSFKSRSRALHSAQFYSFAN